MLIRSDISHLIQHQIPAKNLSMVLYEKASLFIIFFISLIELLPSNFFG